MAKGFRVTKIQRTLQFDQKAYMKKFIDNFVIKRSEDKAKAENSFQIQSPLRYPIVLRLCPILLIPIGVIVTF